MQLTPPRLAKSIFGIDFHFIFISRKLDSVPIGTTAFLTAASFYIFCLSGHGLVPFCMWGEGCMWPRMQGDRKLLDHSGILFSILVKEVQLQRLGVVYAHLARLVNIHQWSRERGWDPEGKGLVFSWCWDPYSCVWINTDSSSYFFPLSYHRSIKCLWQLWQLGQ